MATYLVMKNNFKRSYNNRLLFIVILILPVITILLAGTANQMRNPSQRIGVLAEGNKEKYSNAIYILEKVEDIKWKFADEHTLNTDLISGKYNIVLDYRNTKNSDPFKVLSYGNEEETKSLEAKINDALETSSLIDLNKEEKAGITKTQQMLSFLLTLLIITATLNASVIIKDKRVGTLSRFCYAPTTMFSYIGGNIAHNILLAGGQVILALLALKLFHMQLGIRDADFLIIAFIIILIATAFGTVISCISKSDMKANITSSGITVLFSLLGGAFVSIEKMPMLFQKISVVSPVRWIVEMIKNIESGEGILEQGTPLFILLGITFLLFISSVGIIGYNKLAPIPLKSNRRVTS